MQTILAIDDEISVRESYRMILAGTYRLLLADSALSALELIETKNVDLVLLDLTMPEIHGMEFLARLQTRGESVPVIVVTGSNSVDTAVSAIKQGAREFVVKPFDVDDLLRLVARTLAEVRERRELGALRELGSADFEHIVGDAPALRKALAKARHAMQAPSTVLITGETGTGKDLLARAIHYGGPRRGQPFVPLSCCAIPPNLVESELFGHVKGAFTGAIESRVGKMQVADGGTLFLDEIGEMPLDAQASLLRVLQDGCFYPVGGVKQVEVDVRFICATNRDFRLAITEGRFREDLFYRINVLPIEMPALRHRREDIPRLAAHFIAKHAPRVNAAVREVAPAALARLMAYDWPGNVRELENTIERVLVLHSQERRLLPEFLDGVLPGGRIESLSGLDAFDGLPIEEATARLERHLILRALERCNNVQSQAAEMLGTTRRILKYRMDQLGIVSPGDAHPLAG
jgi:DNA-binding NtrC family response regulator